MTLDPNIFKPYVWQCEAGRCKRKSRDLDTDKKPYYHPECAPKERGSK